MNLNSLFNPKSIAVIGASTNVKKIGRQILDNLKSSGYKGKIYPINLKAKTVAGLNAYADLEEVPEKNLKEMLVVIAIPSIFVIQEIVRCAHLGIKNFIVISAGFKEIGEEGKKLEEELIELADKYKLNILGPNCLGLINNHNNLNASFAKSTEKGGKIALLSQSGAVGSAVLDWLRAQNLNLGYFVSLGNKAVLNETHFLQYLKNDKETEAIIYYLEDIKAGREFMESASLVTPHKPVIVLLAGLSDSGSKLAKSHTGALAKEELVIRAGLERAGVLMVKDLSELFLLILLLKDGSYKKIGKGVNIITNAGGLAVLSADAIATNRLELVSSHDILGDASAKDYEVALEKILKSKGSESTLIILTPQTVTEPYQTAEVIVKLKRKYKKTIITSFVGGNTIKRAVEFLTENNILNFTYPEDGIRSLSLLEQYSSLVKNLKPYKKDDVKGKKKAVNDDYLALLKKISSLGIKTVRTERYEKGKNISKFPVVLKAVGPAFIHKSDKGAVILNLKSQAEVDGEVNKLNKLYAKDFKNENNYLVIQPQVESGLEMIMGIKKDESFGHVLLIGIGGIYAELFKLTKVMIADLNKERALKELKKASFYPILNGARGKKYNVNKIVSAMVSLCALVKDYPEIKELDINPLMLSEEEVLALDARIFID